MTVSKKSIRATVTFPADTWRQIGELAKANGTDRSSYIRAAVTGSTASSGTYTLPSYHDAVQALSRAVPGLPRVQAESATAAVLLSLVNERANNH